MEFEFEKWCEESELSTGCIDTLIQKKICTSFVLSGLTEPDLKDLKLELHDRVCLRKASSLLAAEEDRVRRAKAANPKGLIPPTGTVVPPASTETPPHTPAGDGIPDPASSTGPVPEKATTRTLAQLDRVNKLIAGINGNPLDDLLADDHPGAASLLSSGERKAILITDYMTAFSGSQPAEPPEEILTTSDGRQITVRLPKKKPSADTLQPHQWIAANGRIIKLLLASKPKAVVVDYCDYMTKIGDLLRDYTTSSVFWLDYQHRLAIAESDTKWSDIAPHLKDIHLKVRQANLPSRAQQSTQSQNFNRRQGGYRDNRQNANTNPGDIICGSYNSRAGCTFKNCRYNHICNEPGCTAKHPAYQHTLPPRLQGNSANDSSA